MLPRTQRIVKEKDFGQVITKGRSWRRPEGQLKILPNQLPYNRFGLIVSNKVAKKAHDRNLLKRRIREILRRADLGLKTGYDIVFISYASITSKDFRQIKDLIEEGLNRLNLAKRL